MKLHSITTLAIAAMCSLAAVAAEPSADCSIDISIADITKGEVVPEAINSRLEAKLAQVLSRAGLTSAPYDTRFFIAGRFDDAYNDITGGTSPKVIVKTTLTLYFGDADEQKVFSSESFELKGVGSTEQLAYTRALNSLSASDSGLARFIAQGRQKIVDYYDANYRTYIANARRQMAARNYAQALYYVSAIPSCCRGYDEANALALEIYTQEMNMTGRRLLALARGAWAADPTATGAAEAYGYLAQIDPEADCAAEAKALGDQIFKTTQRQWEFENVTKYENEHDLKVRRIEAARAIGTEYGRNQPKEVHRYTFLTPAYKVH